jgi:hypothetical protein
MQYKLFNFKHGVSGLVNRPNSVAREFSIGPFHLKILGKHYENANSMSHTKRTVFEQTLDGDGKMKKCLKTVPENPQSAESWFETALVEIDDEKIEQSILYPVHLDKKNIDDLCLLLSFLTGRRVCLGTDFEFYTANKTFVQISTPNTIRSFNWDNLPNINQKLIDPFYNIIMSYEQNDVIGCFAYANSAFNIIYEKWYKKHPSPEYDHESMNSICKQTKTYLKCLLKEKDLNSDVIDDALKKMNNLGPSAIYKMKKLLEDTKMCPTTSEGYERVKKINRIRNALVHSGIIEPMNEIGYQVVGLVRVLVQRIVQVYFASHVLKITNDEQLEDARKEIFSYFETGKYMGYAPDKENFDEYMERVESAWIEEGIYL